MRYLVPRPRKGRVAYYWQPTAKLIAAGFRARRLSDIKSEAIRQAEALNAKLDRWYQGEVLPPPIAPDSLAALDRLFQLDETFLAISERSRRDYRYCIKPALEWAGDVAAKSITRKAVKTWLRAQREDRGLSNARNAGAALRRLLSFGLDEGWIAANPCTAMRMPTAPSRRRVWSEAERDGMVAAAAAAGRPSMGLAVMMGWCLGQRPADLRNLTWAAYDGHAIALRQAKTDQPVWVPCLPELRRLLDAMPRTSTQIVVSEATGRPYRESAFQHLFAELRAAAGLPADLQFRDLRRTLATALGAAGCTDDQIRSITGHRTRSVVAVYVRPDRTFAEGAMKQLERAKRRRKLNAS